MYFVHEKAYSCTETMVVAPPPSSPYGHPPAVRTQASSKVQMTTNEALQSVVGLGESPSHEGIAPVTKVTGNSPSRHGVVRPVHCPGDDTLNHCITCNRVYCPLKAKVVP